jgi:hypothetical protein
VGHRAGDRVDDHGHDLAAVPVATYGAASYHERRHEYSLLI